MTVPNHARVPEIYMWQMSSWKAPTICESFPWFVSAPDHCNVKGADSSLDEEGHAYICEIK
jgi:hypothetical protein